MSFTKKAISGFSWQSLLKLSTYALSLVKIYFLARLLSPNDFGLFSLTAVALGISESITQTGVNLTILQSKHSVKYFLDTAWVIAIIRGFVIGSLMVLFGLGMTRFYQEPTLLMLISLAALVPVIKGFINPYIVILHKKMLFFQDTLYRFSFLMIEILAAIAFGYWLQSAFALVLSLVASAVFEVFISFAFFQEKPTFHYLPTRAKPIFANAKWLSFGSLLNYLSENLDDFIIGRVTSTASLGIYHNAYSLTHKANYQLSKSVHHGVIPIFTQITDNQTRLRRGFIKSLLAMAGIALLVSTPLLLAPQWIVEVLLGEQWLAAVPLIRPLVIAGITQSIIAICYTLFLSIKKYRFLNLHLLLGLIVMTSLILLMSRTAGLHGAVNAIMISRLITLPVALAGAVHHFSKQL